MSSVILGIIGVIFFIALAIAGASYLGAGITDAQSQTKAAIVAQSGSQYAAAASIYRIRKRRALGNSLDNANELISSGILRAVPPNPLVPSNTPFTVDKDATLSTSEPAFAIMFLGSTQLARDVCIEIERQAGHTDRLDPSVMSTAIGWFDRVQPGKTGCYRNIGSYGGTNGGQTGDYLAYFSI